MSARTANDRTKREPRPSMILRLLNEAQLGKPCEVSIPSALEFRREAYGLTRREFSAILGLSLGHYGEVINGHRRLPLPARQRAYGIGVPADVLLQADGIESDDGSAAAPAAGGEHG